MKKDSNREYNELNRVLIFLRKKIRNEQVTTDDFKRWSKEAREIDTKLKAIESTWGRTYGSAKYCKPIY